MIFRSRVEVGFGVGFAVVVVGDPAGRVDGVLLRV
jgi:hypothetical protein